MPSFCITINILSNSETEYSVKLHCIMLKNCHSELRQVSVKGAAKGELRQASVKGPTKGELRQVSVKGAAKGELS